MIGTLLFLLQQEMSKMSHAERQKLTLADESPFFTAVLVFRTFGVDDLLTSLVFFARGLVGAAAVDFFDAGFAAAGATDDVCDICKVARVSK